MKTPQTVIARNETTSELYQSGNEYIIVRYLPRVLAAIFCLLLSVNASAQSSDSTKKNTPGKLPVKHAAKRSHKQAALIIVDGWVYKKEIRSIDPTSIVSISILKGKEAESLYGSDGKNGAVIITTKKYQKPDTSKKTRR